MNVLWRIVDDYWQVLSLTVGLFIVVGLLVWGVIAFTPGKTVDQDSYIRYSHDATHQVSCWLTPGGRTLFCLPDSQVANPGR